MPTPNTEPQTMCVVLTGKPSLLAVARMMLAAVSAAKPLIGSKRMMPDPSVLMMRKPPDAVPRPIAVAQEAITQVGMRCSLAGSRWNATRPG